MFTVLHTTFRIEYDTWRILMLTNAHKELIRLLARLAAKDYLEAQAAADASATTLPEEGKDPPVTAVPQLS